MAISIHPYKIGNEKHIACWGDGEEEDEEQDNIMDQLWAHGNIYKDHSEIVFYTEPDWD